jgi:hypothetical protein
MPAEMITKIARKAVEQLGSPSDAPFSADAGSVRRFVRGL